MIEMRLRRGPQSIAGEEASSLPTLIFLLFVASALLATNRAANYCDLLDWLTWIILVADLVIKALDYRDSRNKEP